MWADAIRRARERLADAGVASPDADARSLAQFVLGRRPVPNDAVVPADLERFEEAVRARAKRVPLQHIEATMYFRYLELESRPGVFVVRPETEMVVDAALAEIRGVDDALVVDLCTGSGAIAISIATETDARVIAVELSKEAFESAMHNNARYGSLVTLVQGDAREELDHYAGDVDLVVTNPPYVAPWHDLSPEVRQDPAMALFGGGEDGLELPIALVERAHQLLRPGGILIMEHGDEQGPALCRVAEERGFVEVSTGQDLTGRDRWLRARKDIR
ncbi:peptide chain release factor N(5)-glutamine methyltransferase [Trueperella pecoris]|uniref:Peptide chain release factor N(5)-glutamine methyltransferase n=1 Tax=Trueperella pecoris TaxID=2733571 RepID=A0A7M1R413_9ACTO|nr:peptide chain release factor N(5)-glutamine methyltransferase [Trueperella pecoris]QOR48205.1 peptide chain release factor N(5)-glutamine methyltransferase [Trueperella pecoris]